MFRYFSSDVENEALRKNSFQFSGSWRFRIFPPNEFEWLISVKIYLFGYSAYFSSSRLLVKKNIHIFPVIDIEYLSE